MKAAGIRYEKRRPPSGGRRRRPRGLVAKARSRVFSIDGCVNDAVGRRTSMSRSGSAYATPDVISYTYNDRSELTGAVSNADTTYSYSYAYDPIGNRVTASEAGVPWSYTTNNLNQYTSATENNIQLSFAYDHDGSMTYRPVDATSGWTQVWNGENRMVETHKGNDRLTYKYDYMGRRVEKCVYSGNTLTSKTLFVYDGFKCVEELDALNNNNTVVMRHIWQPFDVGLDVILATANASGTLYFLHDANKNVMQKTAANGLTQEKYNYAPFGWNSSADVAHVGFSSEVMENDAGMVYYNYRYLLPQFGRWIKKDPVFDFDSLIKNLHDNQNLNLYVYTKNAPIDVTDGLGLMSVNVGIISDLLGVINDWIENYTKIRNTNLLVSTIYEKCGKKQGYKDCCCAVSIIVLKDKNPFVTPFIYKVNATLYPYHCDKVFYTGSILYPHQTEVFKKYDWKCCD